MTTVIKNGSTSGALLTPLTVAVDVASAALAALGVVLWGELSSPSHGSSPGLWAFPAFAAVALWFSGLYRTRLRIRIFEELGRIVGATSLATMSFLSVMVALGAHDGSADAVARLWVLALLIITLGRWLRSDMQRRFRRNRKSGTPTLIVGAGVIGAHVARRLHSNAHYGLRPIGFLDAQPLPTLVRDTRTPLLGGPDDLAQIIEATGARHVVVAFSSESDRQLLRISRSCHALGISVSVVPRLFDAVNERVELEHLGGLPLFVLRQVDPRGRSFAAKHALDIFGALLAVVVLSPLLLTIAVAVRMSSPGPILFRQLRVGRDGQTFELLKFRSMAVPRDENPQFRPSEGKAPGGVEGADRRTRVGALLRSTSLDELPQLFNVLRGEMSLVGPRPERPEFVDLFREEIERYGERHRVKAGITGWAQVNGLRGKTSIVDRAEWDNYYIENWSLKLDTKILMKTMLSALRHAE